MSNEQTTFVLVPGYWLGAWAWDEVVARLGTDGCTAVAVTLPGVGTDPVKRRSVTYDDQVVAVLEALPSDGTGILVAHSGAGAVASGVLDRRPERVRRVIYVESGPVGDGNVPRPDLDPDADGLPLPAFDELAAAGASLEGLDAKRLGAFAERAVPQPAGPLRDPIRLSNAKRHQVPATIICSSFSSDQVRGAAAGGADMFAPIAALHDVTYVDLPTGHWPMWSRPDDLARALLDAV